jgi:hypothetical protein
MHNGDTMYFGGLLRTGCARPGGSRSTEKCKKFPALHLGPHGSERTAGYQLSAFKHRIAASQYADLRKVSNGS